MNIIENIEDVKNLIKNNNYKIFGVGGLPFTRSEAYYFVEDLELICSNKTGEFEAVKEKIKLSFFSMPTDVQSKKPENILSQNKVADHIRKSSSKKKVAIYTMRPSKRKKDICKENNWTLASTPLSLFEKYSNKINFYKLLERCGLDRNIVCIKYGDLNKKKKDLFREKKIVIQVLEEEGGGKGTFFFDYSQINQMETRIKERLPEIDKDSELVVSDFCEGPVLSITACVTGKEGVLVLNPQFQLIDIKEVIKEKNNAQGVFCGHDWGLAKSLPGYLIEDSREMAEKIGNLLRKEGYKGIFGIDFIWDQKSDKIIPVEMNPRILGTFPTQVQLQVQNKEVPLAAFHLLECLDIEYSIKDRKACEGREGYKGSHLLLFNFLGKDIIFNKSLRAGVYKIEKEGKLCFLRSGFELSDIVNSKEEFILTDGVPVEGWFVKKNKKLLKIMAKRSISTEKGKKLNHWGERVVLAVQEHIKEAATPI
ncbi:MAG: ATP-grasp domain-containing protein [Patescibacteria group bacterium]